MSVALWSFLAGAMLITMVLAGTLLKRLPLSSAMVYLGLGYLLGPAGLGVITPHPLLDSAALERVAEVAVLISLFAVGLKLGVPIVDRRWILPLRLAFPSMAITVGLIAAAAYWGLGLSLGAAVLLGGILAPTDPVLASAIQSETGTAPDQVRFSLAGEGALNDGSAFPFVLLGLGLMDLHDLGTGLWHWWLIDLVWSTAAGLLIGAIAGALTGRLVVYMRTRHRGAVGLDQFLALGLIALSYGAALLCTASGFLAVFAAGLALNRVRAHPLRGIRALDPASPPDGIDRQVHPHHASATMTRAVRGFNEQLEKLAELAIVLIVGAMLPHMAPEPRTWAFIALLFVFLRPAAVLAGLVGRPLRVDHTAMLGWFGIRGIGSIFYLMFALNHGVPDVLAGELVTLTLTTVAASILAHGISASPAMKWYARHSSRPS